MIRSLLLASSNADKLRELAQAFSSLPIEIKSPADLLEPSDPAPDVDEVANTYVGNAKLKADAFFAWAGIPVIADDSGLEVDALNGGPGIHSARYAPTDDARTEKLLNHLAEVTNRQARMRTVLCCKYAQGLYLVAEGTFEGSIAEEPRGDSGWGYEPVFIPEGSTFTVAEMRDRGERVESHRMKAATLLRTMLSGQRT